jgi:hypothetical protein
MLRTVATRAALCALTVPATLALAAPAARAQAWLPAKGEGSVSILFQDTLVKDHYFITTPYDRGHIQAKSLVVDVTYGLTDKIALTIGIPWVAAKYNGPFPHPLADFSGPNPIDNGTYHSTLQDFRFDVRYNLMKKGMVLTPFVGSVVPSHDYTYFAHSAAGRRLHELQLGVSGAKLLDSLVPGLFIQGRYSYGLTEKVLDISHNRSSMELELGYFVTPKFRLLSLGSGQLTHGGIDIPFGVTLPPVLFAHHDQVDRLNFLNLGGGAAYSLSENVDVFGSLIHTVAARNGHAIDRGLSVGVSWSFSTARSKDRAIASNAENSLVRCACGKGLK